MCRTPRLFGFLAFANASSPAVLYRSTSYDVPRRTATAHPRVFHRPLPLKSVERHLPSSINRHRIALLTVVLAAALAFQSYGAPAHAQILQTWISANGSDSNTTSACQGSAPCLSFRPALSVNSSGGEVGCLGSVSDSESAATKHRAIIHYRLPRQSRRIFGGPRTRYKRLCHQRAGRRCRCHVVNGRKPTSLPPPRMLDGCALVAASNAAGSLA